LQDNYAVRGTIVVVMSLAACAVRTLNLLGDLCRKRGDRAKAEQRYRTSLAVKPGNAGALSGVELLGMSPR
jgi:Flp pilus assembly protein TadD